MSDTTKIRELNDLLRTRGEGGRLVMTQGVNSQGAQAVHEVIKKLKSFDSFTRDNDPNGEHDFGALTHQEQQYLWKIDYYDSTMQCGSPDPANPDVTKRVLTVMLAEE